MDPHINSMLHLFFTPGIFDSFIAVLFFLAGRLSGGIGLLVRVSILIIRMAKHYYDTHPDAKKKKRSTKIDNIFATLYKQKVLPTEKKLLSSIETGAKG